MLARRSARTPADDDGVGHAEAGAGPSGAQGGDPLADQLAAILSAIDGLTQQVRATVTNDEERQAAIALLRRRDGQGAICNSEGSASDCRRS